MRDFISKDPSFAEISKKITKMRKELQSAEKKAADRVTKLLADRLKVAISAHKWKIINRDEYSRYSRSEKDIRYEICLGRVSVEEPKGFFKLATPSLYPNGIHASKVAKASRTLGNKSGKLKVGNLNLKEVKNYDDLIHFAERWDISQIKKRGMFY